MEITWMVDSAGVETAHRNAPNLSQKESYLGALVFNRTEQNWYAIVGGSFDKKDGERLGPFGMNQNSARLELAKRVQK
jgi:hypothetical protein